MKKKASILKQEFPKMQKVLTLGHKLAFRKKAEFCKKKKEKL